MRIENPPQGQVLTRRGEPAAQIWFPHAGIIALTITDDSGRSVQTGLIGPEGCAGLEGLFGGRGALFDATVQIEGEMSMIPLAQLRTALQTRPFFRANVAGFLYCLSAQALQTVACNRLHSMAARCCRWMLMMQDGALSDDLPLTQEALATLLGSGRPRVNMLLAHLEKLGVLQRYRGRIRLLKRAVLEQHACECYRVIRQTTEAVQARTA